MNNLSFAGPDGADDRWVDQMYEAYKEQQDSERMCQTLLLNAEMSVQSSGESFWAALKERS